MVHGKNIEQIIERQARFWEVRERLAEEGGEQAERALAHLNEGPWLTVSKQLGSGGVELAQRLGRELNWQLFDREIVVSIAEERQLKEAVLSRLDEQAIGSFNDYIAQLLVPNDPGQLAYLEELVRVIWGLARQGNAIILGRGANWFLNATYGLRARVIAPFELRAERIAREEGITIVQAGKKVKEHDVKQAAYIHQVYGRDINDPLGYDLTLNTGELDLESCAVITLAALRRRLEPARTIP